MTYSIILKSTFFSLCFLGSTSLYATPATDSTINKFIQLSELNSTLNNNINELQPYFDSQAEQIIQSISSNNELDANEIAISLKLSQKMFDMTKKTVTSPQTIKTVKQVIKNIYTEEEILAYNKFLSTPEGKSINQKSSQAMMEIQTAIEDLATQTMKNSDYEKEIIKIIEPLAQQ